MTAMRGERVRDGALLLFLVVAVLLGGGGVVHWQSKLIVQLAAVLLLAVSLTTLHGRLGRRTWHAAILLALGAAVLPLLQLVPLPPAVWQRLPLRDDAVDALSLIGRAATWRPLTLAPQSTWLSAFAMLPGLACFLAAGQAKPAVRARALRLIVVLALVSLAVGVVQAATAGAFPPPFHDTPHRGTALGFFANRNHQADLMLIAPVLVATVLRLRPDAGRNPALPWLGLLALTAFVAGAVATISRAALVLSPVAVAITLPLLWSRRDRAGTRPGRSMLLVLAAGIALLGGLLLTSGTGSVVLTRFAASDGARTAFWPDVWYALTSAFPIGTGLGTFIPVFNSVEQLAIVQPTYVVHAHNDYAELVLEGGLYGAILIGTFALIYGTALWRTVRGRTDIVAAGATLAMAVPLLHSLVDYPLRTPTLSAIFGVLAAFAFARDQVPPVTPRSEHAPSEL